MILYFSGTGNSKWVASLLAKKLNDKSYDICTIDDEIDLSQEKQIGFDHKKNKLDLFFLFMHGMFPK